MNPTRAGFTSIAPWVRFGRGCVVHPFACLGIHPSQSPSLARKAAVIEELWIGDGTEIRPHATIYGGARIGNHCLIGDGANIREGVDIGNHCIIGCNVSINYDAQIADDVRIMNGTHITGGTKIGSGTFIGANVTTMNDRSRAVVDYVFTSTDPPIIGERCLIGSGAVILPGVIIGDGACIGAGACVVASVPAGATVLGRAGTVKEV